MFSNLDIKRLSFKFCGMIKKKSVNILLSFLCKMMYDLYILLFLVSLYTLVPLSRYFMIVILKEGENDDRSCYENLMEDINNFKIVIQNENILCCTRFGWNQQHCRKLFIESTKKDCYQIPCYFKTFGWTEKFVFDESGFLSRYNTQQVVSRVSQYKSNFPFYPNTPQCSWCV